MLRSLTYGAAGIKAFQSKIDIISNNVANINTTAYKSSSSSVHFAEQVQKLAAGPAASVNWNVENGMEQIVGNGVEYALTLDRDISSTGNITTDRTLDLAIEGSGYLAVELPQGEVGYTRDGAVDLNEEGFLVTKQGYRLLPAVKVPEDYQNILIAENGEVRVTVPDSDEGKKIGEIHLYKFKNSKGLRAEGENIFSATNTSGSAREGIPGEGEYGILKQGKLELSNVDLITEMAELIEAQRAYQVNARSVRTSDEMWGMAANLRK